MRVDTGVYEGGEVSIHYDPMIAKLITYGGDRDQAIGRMRDALNEFYIRGVSHNISFLGALVNHPRFAAGQLSTNLIAEEYPDGFDAADVVHDDPLLLVATCGAIHRRYRERAARISGQLAGYEPQGRRRLGRRHGRRKVFDHRAARRRRLRCPPRRRHVPSRDRLAIRPAAVPRPNQRRRRFAFRSSDATSSIACSIGGRRST